MRIQVKEFSSQEAKEIEEDLYIQDHKATKQYLKQRVWDYTADGHNANRPHKNCPQCEQLIQMAKVLSE